MASNSSFAFAIDSCTRSTRFTGSASSVGSDAKMADTRFVHFSVSSPVRIETGIIAPSGLSGSASCCSSHVRSPPAHTAITTSFTVAPSAFLMPFTDSSDADRNANRRCGVIGALNGVGGADSDGSGPLDIGLRRPLAPDVQHGAERAAQAVAHLVGRGRERRVASGPAEVAGGARTEHERAARLAGQVRHGPRQHLRVGRRTLGDPLLRLGQLVTLRRRVEHQREQLGARRAVDRRRGGPW